MYLYQTFKGTDAIEFCETKLELDPSEYDLATVTRVEIYNVPNPPDGGEDYCEARVIDSSDTIICLRRMYSF